MKRHLLHRLKTAKARYRVDLAQPGWIDQLGEPRLVRRKLDDAAISASHAPSVQQLRDSRWWAQVREGNDA